MDTRTIRNAFTSYFEKQGHTVVPSSSLVPGNDPSLLFTNAGMVQFKDVFLGVETRPYTKAVTVQKCLRAGGKHNDLDNVGYTARHHTFFEMLGNFSFGAYFKKEAIQYAWGFLTEVLKLPVEKLWVTVHEKDIESERIWLEDMGIDKTRFSRCGDVDNFWSMGDTGPCGPCTEIFYDHGPEIAGGPPGTPEADGDRYIEIWNLVFMQFNRDKEGTMHPLERPCVDTGMGLERIAAVLQHVHTNYDIDIFCRIIDAIFALTKETDSQQLNFRRGANEQAAGVYAVLNEDGERVCNKAQNSSAKSIYKQSNSIRVIADHIRAIVFLILDGVSPSNEGRGYVLRRIIRRAVRHGQHLDLQAPFLYQLVTAIAEIMGDAYPDLIKEQKSIAHVIRQEEEQFVKTLDKGMALLKEAMSGIKDKSIPGDVVFKLYDTYGFPYDLTADIAREHDMEIDLKGFETAMDKQRSQSQAKQGFRSQESHVISIDTPSEFHGYDATTMTAHIVHMNKEATAIVLDKTPFYAESGGQVGDVGKIESKEGLFEVHDTKRVGDAIVHYGVIKKGHFKVDEEISAAIDVPRRESTRLNHTATHLLHAALRHVLGPQVQQKGSLVAHDRARFDFAYNKGLTLEEIESVENLVNARIRMNSDVSTTCMHFETAKSSGAIALFGEKYGDEVRVLSIDDFSKELCGGTHARRTGDIGLFKIISENGIASGVRRIEMLTGQYALDWGHAQNRNMGKMAQLLKSDVGSLISKLEQYITDTDTLRKTKDDVVKRWLEAMSHQLVSKAQSYEKGHILISPLDEIEPGYLRIMMDILKNRLDPSIIVLYTIHKNQLHVIVHMHKTYVTENRKAPLIVQHLCGKGGGRDDMAQGGSEVPKDMAKRLETLETMLHSK
jgi:alanyl-tRNA synthetase